MPQRLNILILGGTTEARRLAERLASVPSVAPILSLAGRTSSPHLPPIAYRIGGFGGMAGLIDYLRAAAIDLVIDATHPFAEQISAHAEAACRETFVPLVIFTRAPWTAQEGDRWIEVESASAAAAALGGNSRRVFLTVGRLQLPAFSLAPIHHYLIRSIDPPDPLPALPSHKIILARGPFALADEIALMREEKIDVLVTKNSGGAATYAKIEAARHLAVPVVMIRPPACADLPIFYELEEVLQFIAAHRHQKAPAPRGV